MTSAPEVLHNKVIVAMQRFQTTIDEGTPAQSSAAKHHLRKMAAKFPAEAEFLGYAGGKPQAARVPVFGCLAAPKVLEATLKPGEMGPIERQERLRHAFYNALVTAALPFREAYLTLLAGTPAQQEYRTSKDRLTAAKAEQAALVQPALAARDSAAAKRIRREAPYQALQAEVRALIARQRELKPTVTEDKAKMNGEDGKKRIDAERFAALTAVRKHFVGSLGLWDKNMGATMVQFTTAYKNSLRSIDSDDHELGHRYTDKDGNFPDDLLTWEKWNHEGCVSIQVTHKGDPNKAISSVYDGTNTQFQLRPLTKADWLQFNTHRPLAFDETDWKAISRGRFEKLGQSFNPDKAAKLFLARVRVGSLQRKPVWASVPVVVHTPLPLDAELSEVNLHSRKEGLRLKHSLNVTILNTAAPTVKSGAVAEVSITLSKGEPCFALYRRDESNDFTDWTVSGTDGRKFAWLDPAGRVLVDPTFLQNEKKTLSIFDTISMCTSRCIEAIRGDAKKGTAGVLTGHESEMPEWIAGEKHRWDSRSGMRRLYRSWRYHLTEDANKVPSRLLRLTEGFRSLRALARSEKGDLHHAMLAVGYKAEELLPLSELEAMVFGILTVFVERYEHLYEWAVNNRLRAQRRRLDQYRKFAANFLKGVRLLRLPDIYLATRTMSEEQRAACPSQFLAALKNYAKREGITIEEVKPIKAV